MTIKTKRNKNKKLNKDVKKVQRDLSRISIKAKKTPFADAGAIAGRGVGRFFGIPNADKIGRWLGSGIGSIFGSGDYEMVGGTPGYNVLAGHPPQFSSSRATNIVCHREYLGDIAGTTNFAITEYALNPGMQQTFPWLSSVAANYQQYRIHGMVFEFKSLITDYVTSGAPGVVVMSTNYNSDQVAYGSRQEMENSEFAVSTKPTVNLLHMIECDAAQTIDPIKYVRTGSVPDGQDLRLYDQGKFQFATQGNPTQDLGELWVTYCVEFYKPILVPDYVNQGLAVYHAAISNTSPLGIIYNPIHGNISATVTNYYIEMTGLVVGRIYEANIYWYTSSVAWAPPALTLNYGCTAYNKYLGHTQSEVVSPQSGVTCTSANLAFAFTATDAHALITFGNMIIGSGTADIYINADTVNEE